MKSNTDPRFQSLPALAAIIADQGRTKRWLSQRANVSESLIGKIVTGERTASKEVATELADALSVPLFVLFSTRDGVFFTPIGGHK